MHAFMVYCWSNRPIQRPISRRVAPTSAIVTPASLTAVAHGAVSLTAMFIAESLPCSTYVSCVKSPRLHNEEYGLTCMALVIVVGRNLALAVGVARCYGLGTARCYGMMLDAMA